MTQVSIVKTDRYNYSEVYDAVRKSVELFEAKGRQEHLHPLQLLHRCLPDAGN